MAEAKVQVLFHAFGHGATLSSDSRIDTLFVETTGGDLTIKVENNTESGQGIHSEPVEDKTQSLDDATFDFARVGSLILLKVLPYRENVWRGFIYNTLTGRVQRNDAIIQVNSSQDTPTGTPKQSRTTTSAAIENSNC